MQELITRHSQGVDGVDASEQLATADKTSHTGVRYIGGVIATYHE